MAHRSRTHEGIEFKPYRVVFRRTNLEIQLIRGRGVDANDNAIADVITDSLRVQRDDARPQFVFAQRRSGQGESAISSQVIAGRRAVHSIALNGPRKPPDSLGDLAAKGIV